MLQVVAKSCSTKKLSKKFHKIHREIPVLDSISNTVERLQAVWLATLLKRDPVQVFQNQPFIDLLQNRYS